MKNNTAPEDWLWLWWICGRVFSFLKVSVSAESLLKKKIIFHIILPATSDSLCKGGSSLYDRFKQNHAIQWNHQVIFSARWIWYANCGFTQGVHVSSCLSCDSNTFVPSSSQHFTPKSYTHLFSLRNANKSGVIIYMDNEIHWPDHWKFPQVDHFFSTLFNFWSFQRLFWSFSTLINFWKHLTIVFLNDYLILKTPFRKRVFPNILKVLYSPSKNSALEKKQPLEISTILKII